MNTDVASQSPEVLLQAFTGTDYHVRVGDHDDVIRPGRRHPRLDEALRGHRWAVVTACNPNARQLGDIANEQRHRRLIDAVDQLGLEAHPAVNRDPDGHWPDEKGLLIVALKPHDLDKLAAQFGQAAVVTGSAKRPALLRLYGDHWPSTLPDWAGRAG